MNILFTLCGRAGSKGIKNKNLKHFLGAPLVYYALASIKECIAQLDMDVNYRVVLNTDSQELVDLTTAQTIIPVDVLWRDESLGGDTISKVDVIKDCYHRGVKLYDMDFDMVVDLDITSPLRCAQDVKNAIIHKSERPDTDVVYSVTGSRRNPYFNMVKEEDGFFVRAIRSNVLSRQQAPVFYDMNASIYAYAPKALREKPTNVFLNDGASAIMMKDTAVLDIDSEEDYELMEVIGAYLYEKYENLAQIRNTALELYNSIAK